MLSGALVVATADAHDHIDTLQDLFFSLVRFNYGEQNTFVAGSWMPRLTDCFGALPSMIVSHNLVYPRRSSSALSAELGGAGEAQLTASRLVP